MVSAYEPAQRAYFPEACCRSPERGSETIISSSELTVLRALLRIDAPDWRLHLVGGGSGSEKQACLDLARDSNGRIRLHGTVEQIRLAAIMKAAHVFVLPSFFEGLPLVILEALACGCRIVATDLPGSELLGDLRVDYISRVKLPALHGVDRPLPVEEAAFERRLEGALRCQIEAAAARPTIELSSIAPKLARFTWSGIFERVQEVYIRAIRNKAGLAQHQIPQPPLG
jgi:glycosyltransferase involved in cell wall biosynthesis